MPLWNQDARTTQRLQILEKNGDALARIPADARIFSSDGFGGFLIYRFHGDRKVFFDGRSDFYGAKFDQDDYLDVMNAKYTWQNTLTRYSVDTILLPVDAPLTGVLKETSRWRVVYDDGIALVFRPIPPDAAAGELTNTRARDLPAAGAKPKT